MKNEKNYMGFHIPKVWQILKRFAGAFHQAQTSYFWRVYMQEMKYLHMNLSVTFETVFALYASQGKQSHIRWLSTMFFSSNFPAAPLNRSAATFQSQDILKMAKFPREVEMACWIIVDMGYYLSMNFSNCNLDEIFHISINWREHIVPKSQMKLMYSSGT